MKNPFEVANPDSLQLGQLSAAMGSLMKQLAWDLGERYDLALARKPPPLGRDWLRNLENARGERYSLHDPSFVFGEPEFYAESAVWQALPPRTPELVGQFSRVRITRNRWEHQAARQDAKTFKEGVLRVQELAQSIQETHVMTTCEALLERFEELKAGRKPATSGRSELITQLKQMLETAREEAERLNTLLGELRKQNDKKGAVGEALAADLAAQQQELIEARARAGSLQEQLFLTMQENRIGTDEPADNLRPGDAWNIQLPTKVLQLKKRIVDLVDRESGSLLSDEIGPVARDSARRWLKIMPNGGPVHMTDAGNAAAMAGGRYVYLGRLDDALLEAEGLKREDIAGALMYELTPDLDLLDYETGDLISDRMGTEAQRIGSRLSTVLSPGERFRLTSGGHALVVRDGQLRDLGSVAPDGLG